MLMTVSNISSPTVMIFELDWNPLCVTTMSANSLAMSTFDISSADGVSVRPSALTDLMFAVPELFDSV